MKPHPDCRHFEHVMVMMKTASSSRAKPSWNASDCWCLRNARASMKKVAQQ
ncbi:hypothetical protein CPter91_4037 [Collimonas pratensis]|uniref:Uncharacterized protein n=1 Tax=Collimonas pratensis TaxID=279113 RepID=A0A127Q8H9_9BURK|nr:hypothetical protein CPter91_4037 [Collimonas pratensis]